MRLLLAAALISLASSMASAQPADIVTNVETVGDLAAVCDPAWSGVPRLEAIAYCQGFIASAGQYHAMLHPPGGAARPLYCLPTPPPTIAQTGVAFAAWARANPGHRSEAALDGLIRWLQATYPCPATAAPARPSRAR